jgi:hypothetical protein
MTYAITATDIATLRHMRSLQKRFFEGDRTVVGQSKAAERAVDKLLARFPDPDARDLFAETEPTPAPCVNDLFPFVLDGLTEDRR